jgi:hypothetical protein
MHRRDTSVRAGGVAIGRGDDEPGEVQTAETRGSGVAAALLPGADLLADSGVAGPGACAAHLAGAQNHRIAIDHVRTCAFELVKVGTTKRRRMDR